jgi:hypothetical protein
VLSSSTYTVEDGSLYLQGRKKEKEEKEKWEYLKGITTTQAAGL